MDLLHAYLFCPRCGAKFTDKNAEYLHCGTCGLKFYDSPKPGAGIIPIDPKGKILLTERAIDPHKGKLDMLGGFLQKGESFEDGAKREALEELGLKLDSLKYFTSYVHNYEYQDVKYTLVVVIFTARINSSLGLKAADDIAGYQFFDPKTINADMLAFPELKIVLDSFGIK